MNGRWPLVLIAGGLLVSAFAFGLAKHHTDTDLNTLKRILGLQLCRQVALTEQFEPTDDIPRPVLERSIRNLQQSRRELGLDPCPRRER